MGEVIRRVSRETWLFAGLAVVILALPGPLPTGSVLLGVAGGAGIALHAIGIVLVYRSDRIINIAQVQLGIVGALVFGRMVEHRTMLVGLAEVCPSCVPLPSPEVVATLSAGETPIGELSRAEISALAADGWLIGVNTVVALVVGLLVSALVAGGVYFGLVRRFRTAPRLVLTVLTIGVTQTLAWLGGLAVGAIGTRFGGAPIRASLSLLPEVTVAGTNISGPQVGRVLLAVAVATGLTLVLRRTAVGVALRGVAENPTRSETLGVDVSALVGGTWVVAGLLSYLAAVLAVADVGLSPGDAGLGALTRVLAATVIGAFVSFPVAVAGAIAIGVLDQAALVSFSTVAVTDALLLGVVLVVLRAQKPEAQRVDADLGTGFVSSREVRPIPAELRAVPSVRRGVTRVLGTVAVMLAALPWVLSPSQTNLAANAVVFAVVGLSLLVLTGWAGQVSLGQFAFAAVGAWVTASSGLVYPLSLVAAAMVGGLVAVAIGFPALRLRGLNLAVTTLAFAGAVPAIVLSPRYLGSSLPDVLSRPFLLGIDLDDERAFFYFVLLHLAAAVAVVVGLRRSRAGRVLIAVRENAASAESFAIDPRRSKLTAFAISGSLAGAAGSLFAYSQFGVNGSSFGVDASVRLFLMTVIGGLGSIAGPLLGATYLGVIQVFDSPLLSLAATGVGTVALMLLAPGGLVEVVSTIRDSWLRRVADRQRISVPSLFEDRRADDIDGRVPIAPLERVAGRPDRRYRVDGEWT